MVTREVWEAAAVRLLDDEYIFLATGPREHDEWAEDVLLTMARATADPRGWLALDWDTEHERRRENPSYPFTCQTVERLKKETFELSPESAAEQLVLMLDDWFAVSYVDQSGKSYPDLLADARTTLSRYENQADFYTTAVDAKHTTTPDFSKRATAGLAFTDYIYDLGLIIVNPEEVGVVWRFNAE